MQNELEQITTTVEQMATKSATAIQTVNAEIERLKENAAGMAARTQSIEQAVAGHQNAGTAFDFDPAGTLVTFGSDEAVQAFAADRSIKSANVRIDMALPLLVKSVVGDSGASNDAPYSVQPQRDGRLGGSPMRRLTVFDVLPRLPVTSNSFEFNSLDNYSNAATYQSQEGAAKQEGDMPTVLVTAPITTIAHYFKLSEQVLSDAPALQMQVENLLSYGVLSKASAEIIAGATSGKIQGLVTKATTYVATGGPELADAIGAAGTHLDVSGWNANLVIMHPLDWFAIRSERSLSENAYVAGGWATAGTPTIWGMDVVTDPSVSQGHPLVLDRSQVAILDRMQARVEFGRSGDDMIKNLVTALGELRAGLAVFSPSAVLKVTIAS